MNKNVIISGGSSGIGLSTVKKFSEEGYSVYVLDIKESNYTYSNQHFIYCDVSDTQSIRKALRGLIEKKIPIDALVCNAGIHFSANLESTTQDDYCRVMDINFKGAFFLTKEVLCMMVPQERGSIVFVGSDQTLVAKPNSAIYGATKAALGSLAKTTAIDYAKYGIRSNMIAVGTTDTPLYRRAIENYCQRTSSDIADVHQAEAREQPIGRIGTPEEIADFIYFLCSDKASFITGSILPIDGGYTAR